MMRVLAPGRRLTQGPALLAVAPAVVLAALAVLLNHFALLDDWVNLAQTQGDFLGNFRIHDSGRFNFFYLLFHWVVVRVLAPEPWALSVANGLCVVAGAWQVYRLTRRLGAAALGGVVAAWLFTLNISTAENLFTLGKPEPKQLVGWLLALALFAHALEGVEDRWRRYEAPLMAVAAASSILFKETGLLLAAPLAVFALVTATDWRGARAEARRRRVALMVACAIPLSGGLAMTVAYGLRKGTYAHDQVMSRPLRLADFDLALFRSDATLALLLLAGLAAGVILLASGRRTAVMLVLAQLAAIAGFYTYYRSAGPYYYYPAAALAAVLIGARLFPWRQRGRVWMIAAVAIASVFLAYGGVRSTTGAWALTRWSWLHDRLVAAVVEGRPPRALFYESGSAEVHHEASIVWEGVHRLPLMTGVLEPAEAWKAPPRGVSVRDLARGDWILEQFGSWRNASVPLRDLNVTRSTEHALMGPAGTSLLPIRLLHQYEVRFWYPTRSFELVPRWPGFLQWRVYEVTDRPRVTLEGLADGRWMEHGATLWVRRGALSQVTLRFSPFVHAPLGGFFDNELTVRLGEHVLARCPVRSPGTAECRVKLAPLEAPHGDEWVSLDLIPARTFSPRRLGLSSDPRDLSFNFAPTWEAGLNGLIQEGSGG